MMVGTQSGFTDETGRFHPDRHYSAGSQGRPIGPTVEALPQKVEAEADLDRWRGERATAAALVEDLEDERPNLLLRGSVEQIAALDARLATARVRVERAGAVIADAERRFAEHAERERAAQPRRRAKHAAAVKARAEAEELMREVYAPAAAKIGACLARLVLIGAIIDAANSDLPDGAERVAEADAFRGYPSVAERTVEEDETYYVNPRTGQEIRPSEFVPKVLGFDPNITMRTRANMIELAARTRKKPVRVAGRSAYTPPPLGAVVELPGLMHDDPQVWPTRPR